MCPFVGEPYLLTTAGNEACSDGGVAVLGEYLAAGGDVLGDGSREGREMINRGESKFHANRGLTR